MFLPSPGLPHEPHMGPKSVLERASGSTSIKIWSERAPRGLRAREKIVREGLRSEKKESKRDLNELGAEISRT